MLDLTCECCGKQASLEPEAAFQAGWDAPPYFTMVTVCPRCPSSRFIMGEECTHDWTDERYQEALEKMRADPSVRLKVEQLIKIVSIGNPDMEEKLRKSLL